MMAIPIAMIVGAPVSEALLKLDGVLRPARLAVAVPGRRPARGDPRRRWRCRYLTDRPERRRVAAGRRPRVAGRGDGARSAPSARHRQHALGARQLLKPQGRAAVRDLLPQHHGHLRRVPVAAQDPARSVRATTGFKLSAITALPFVAALVGMVLIGRHSDRTGERKMHVAACAMTAAIGLVLAVAFQNSVPIIVLSFMLSQVGQRSRAERLLVDSADLPRRHGGGRRHRPHQLGRQPGRLRRPAPSWAALRDSTQGYRRGLLVLAAAWSSRRCS